MLILRDIILPSLAATIRCAIVSSVCPQGVDHARGGPLDEAPIRRPEVTLPVEVQEHLRAPRGRAKSRPDSGPVTRSFVSGVFAFYPKGLYTIVSFMVAALVVFSALFPGKLQLPCLTRHLAEGDVFDGKVLTASMAEELEAVRSEGMLVTYGDGYWWVFDENGRFTAIPSDNRARMVVESPSVLACPYSRATETSSAEGR